MKTEKEWPDGQEGIQKGQLSGYLRKEYVLKWMEETSGKCCEDVK